MELAKSDLDMPEEIAPEQVARDGHSADGGIEGEAPELRMREDKTMNSRADTEACRSAQPHFSSSQQINIQSRNQERAIEDRKLSPGVKIGIEVTTRSIAPGREIRDSSPGKDFPENSSIR